MILVGVPASHIFVNVAVQTATFTLFVDIFWGPEGDNPLRRVQVAVPSARSPVMNVLAISTSILPSKVVTHPVHAQLPEA